MDTPPADPADHAEDFAHRWADKLDEYAAIRMVELGIPDAKIGATDPYRRKAWYAFDAEGRVGGSITTGITVDSGCLNPDLLKGANGGRIWPKARLRDRIDAIIAHEYDEDRLGSHLQALKRAPRSGLPITAGARRILRAMGR